MLPEIIKNGVLVSDNIADHHQKSTTKTFAYISYDTTVDGVPITVKLDIKNRLSKTSYGYIRFLQKKIAPV